MFVYKNDYNNVYFNKLSNKKINTNNVIETICINNIF